MGNYKGFDPTLNSASDEIIEDGKSKSSTHDNILANSITAVAWAEKGIRPQEVGDGGFKFAKIGSSGSFFNWGLIELGPDQMKRTKNSRFMHMVFNVQSGTVEVRMHENEFTVHKQGIWQVPRGTLLSFLPHCPSISSSPHALSPVTSISVFPRFPRLCTTAVALCSTPDGILHVLLCTQPFRVVRSCLATSHSFGIRGAKANQGQASRRCEANPILVACSCCGVGIRRAAAHCVPFDAPSP